MMLMWRGISWWRRELVVRNRLFRVVERDRRVTSRRERPVERGPAVVRSCVVSCPLEA